MARVSFRVRPQAKRSALTGRLGEHYKLDVAAPPVDGRANEECIRYLAEFSGLHHSKIRLIAGQTNRTKVFQFEGMATEDVKRRLDEAL
jgi:uncharacterized protein YggU (UPF0235/DUF167 family)